MQPSHSTEKPLIGLYEAIAGDEDARVCQDIPEAVCDAQPVNFFIHLIANTLSKIGDELASAPLVLAWILLIGGVFGLVAQLAGTEFAILLLALFSLAGAISAWRMSEV